MCEKRDNFCFICGYFTDSVHKVDIVKNKLVIELYEEYFGRSFLNNQNYIPNISCSSCSTKLKLWKTQANVKRSMPFSEPTIWLPVRVHRPLNCYFCLTITKGYHFAIRHLIKYADVDNVIKPVKRQKNDDVPVASALQSDEHFIFDTLSESAHASTSSEYIPPKLLVPNRHFVTHEEFCDLVRDLELSKKQTELLGSRMQQWNFLNDDVNITFSRSEPTKLFENLFSLDTNDDNLAYCCNVSELFLKLGQNHISKEWRLFIDGSTKSKLQKFKDFLIEF